MLSNQFPHNELSKMLLRKVFLNFFGFFRSIAMNKALLEAIPNGIRNITSQQFKKSDDK
jgi:hypothetical protein